MSSIIDTITTQWTIYPDGQGHFAFGSPNGRTLKQGEAVEISLGGFWIIGAITWSHNGDYFTAQVDHTRCGLCAGMRVRILRSAGGETRCRSNAWMGTPETVTTTRKGNHEYATDF